MPFKPLSGNELGVPAVLTAQPGINRIDVVRKTRMSRETPHHTTPPRDRPMKKIALVASLFVFAACGAKTEEAAPAADTTTVAPAATTDSAAPVDSSAAAPAADSAK